MLGGDERRARAEERVVDGLARRRWLRIGVSERSDRLLGRVVLLLLLAAAHDHLRAGRPPDRRLVARRRGTGAVTPGRADDPARLVAPSGTRSGHREEALVPDDLAGDLEADPRRPAATSTRVDAGVPDVADLEDGHEGERLGPVDPGVARDRRVAVALRSPVGATVRSCGARLVGGGAHAHVGRLGRTQGVVHAVAPGRVERDAVGRVGREERSAPRRRGAGRRRRRSSRRRTGAGGRRARTARPA